MKVSIRFEIIDETIYKLYKPFLPYKDELAIWDRGVKKEMK